MAGVMIAAPGSGSGKTMVTCALLTLLKRKGWNPAAFKCGPDYIDGLFHRRVLGVDSGNLDSFFETKTAMTGKVSRVIREHFLVVEGVMGYFDGLGGTSVAGSSCEIADILGLPVILVVDAKGASLSLCALIKGFLEYGACANHIQGVFFNRMSPGMYKVMKELVEEQLRVPVIGYLPELEFLKVGSRHLGLVLPGEIDGLKEQMEKLADRMDEGLDWEQLCQVAAALGSPGEEKGVKPMGHVQKARPSFRLGIAMDEAFCFYYRDNLEALEQAGAKLVCFSPVHDRQLPEGVDGLILGGGYPENYGEALASNASMRRSVAAAAAAGMPILAECGGYLYLLDSLEGADGRDYPMAGVFCGHGFYAGKTGRFGYITAEAEEELPFLDKGHRVKGHEFHYWDCRCGEEKFRMRAVKPRGNRSWPCMRTANRVMAGFPHLYYPSGPELVQRFVAQCMTYRKEMRE